MVKTLVINLVVFLALFEIASRGYLSFRRGASLLDPSSTARFYYPEMNATKTSTSSADWNILLLGASVLNPAWGSVETELKTLLSRYDLSVRIHNLAIPAHTTRDSLNKYQLLKEHAFDRVFVYHGINELRMNNYPLDRFKEDYSHIHWYRTVNPLIQHTELSFFASPFMFKHTWFKLTCKNDDEQFEHHKYGGLLKTERAFYTNLENIIKLAEQKKENLLLATYAYHLPANYQKDAFHAKKLDYNAHRMPVEAWGQPEHIKIGLEKHNGIIRRLANDKKVPCVEIANRIAGQAANFDDICHLTQQGSRRFAEIIAPLLSPPSMATK